MSYILEALKKSSEERGRLSHEANPGPVFVSASEEGRGSLLPWRGIAIVSLIGLIAMAAFWVGTNVRNVRTPAPDQRLPPLDSAASAQPSTQDQSLPPVADPSPLGKPKIPPSAAVASEKVSPKAPVSAKPTEEAPARTLPEPPREFVAKSSAPVRNAAPAAVSSAPAPSVGMDMSPELLKQVQSISIAAHVFSRNPPDRMVIIDGRAVREGDTLPSGVSVEQITPSGVTLNYKGYRANKPVVQ